MEGGKDKQCSQKKLAASKLGVVEMINERFLLEFPSDIEVARVKIGEWRWKSGLR